MLVNFLILLLLLFNYFSLNVYLEGKFGYCQYIQQDDVKLRHCVNEVMPGRWKWLLNINCYL